MTRTNSVARRRLIIIVSAGLVVLVLAGIGIYGLLTGPSQSPEPEQPPPTPEPSSTSSELPSELPVIEPSTDPETFARNAAHALFTWDTGAGLMPLDYQSVILQVGDPSGAEQAGLASDVAAYLPTREAWTDLREYSTSQYLSIYQAYTPEAWSEAVEQAQPGQLPEGATAITIQGTRHRDGMWNGEPTNTTHEVAFTLFIACPPPPDTDAREVNQDEIDGGNAASGGGAEDSSCYLLRLSMLDQPLT